MNRHEVASFYLLIFDPGPEYSLEGIMLKLNLQDFGHLMRRADSFEKILTLGKVEARSRWGQQRMRGWMASLTQWIWVWASSRRRWRTGKPGACSPCSCKESDTTEQLNNRKLDPCEAWYWSTLRLTFSPPLHDWQFPPCTETPSVSSVRPHKDGAVIDAAARNAATDTDARPHRWLGALRVTREAQRRPAFSLLGWDATRGMAVWSWSKKSEPSGWHWLPDISITFRDGNKCNISYHSPKMYYKTSV